MNKGTFDRTRALISKHISTQLRNFRPTAIKGRFVGPKVLVNSIPKAGTNLLEQALGQFPLLHRSGFRTLRGWETVSSYTLEKLRRLERGGVKLGHLPAHQELMAAIDENDIRTLLMVRDPRDMLVSYVKYVTKIDLTHPAHPYFVKLPDDHARLLAAINGVEGVVSPASETLRRFSGWLNSDAMVVRFEDIIGSKGGGSDERQFEVVNQIADFIGIEISNDNARKICGAVYSPTAITFRKPQINGWREVFKDEHIAALESKAGDLLKRFGYGDSAK
ncbi:sulfotransferase domain-containing protein [Thiohalomonas denitrificans]|uniref:Sulfotransferase domain-containing protein n=1 Tax=Thiohalomonas denitrificans TaxID=415747 RepID=A0A1G5QZM0_9GAMM|nr:sulfotransferase domain-containing protein [Thiohalomonas denitrificans]SCZ67295.1 Sulfotransferase domain-containing protein [Thiohalomonas denitrificans]